METNKLHFIISDDGKGFDTGAVSSRNGIKNMQHRISRWKGSMRIESNPGRGTRTIFVFPVDKASLK